MNWGWSGVDVDGLGLGLGKEVKRRGISPSDQIHAVCSLNHPQHACSHHTHTHTCMRKWLKRPHFICAPLLSFGLQGRMPRHAVDLWHGLSGLLVACRKG